MIKYNSLATSGNNGQGVRSDCSVSIEVKESGGIRLILKSKVRVMYGASITELVNNELKFFGIDHALVEIDDSGALEFVMMARIEAAVKQISDSKLEYLPAMLPENEYFSTKERFRFSRLYLPGNTPNLMINAGIHKPDGIILDLEDSVAPVKKHEARYLVRNALRAVNFFGAERMVRINQIPDGLRDIDFIEDHNVHLILVPKCENAEQIHMLDEKISSYQHVKEAKRSIYYMPIIESALGVENAYSIASSSQNIVAMAIGLEDYTADLGVKRTREATESFYARTRLVNACKAAGVQPIDSVFSDVADMESLTENVRISKTLGFEGMGCIHPRQIRVIQSGFAPDTDEIEKAMKIANAYYDALEKGLGVVSLGTKMIDPPVVRRAEKTIQLAVKLGLLKQDWRNSNTPG